MKKALKFAGLFAFVLALVGFILLMASHSIAHDYEVLGSKVHDWYSGTAAIFGKGNAVLLGTSGEFEGSLAWSALLSWIFSLVAMLILCMGVVLPLLKVKALEKIAGLLNLIAVGLLVVGGVFAFLTKGAFAAANEYDLADWTLGAGWVIAGILFILAGLVAIAPAAVDFLGKKK